MRMFLLFIIVYRIAEIISIIEQLDIRQFEVI